MGQGKGIKQISMEPRSFDICLRINFGFKNPEGKDSRQYFPVQIKNFGNSWDRSHTKFILLEIKSRFTYGELKL